MKKKLPIAFSNEIIPGGYKALLETLKSRIHSSQPKAIIKVNEELIALDKTYASLCNMQLRIKDIEDRGENS